MTRVPTPKQYLTLMVLGDVRGLMISGLGGSHRRQWEALLKHGWLEAECETFGEPNGLRITPAGLRALADGLERYGVDPRQEPAG